MQSEMPFDVKYEATGIISRGFTLVNIHVSTAVVGLAYLYTYLLVSFFPDLSQRTQGYQAAIFGNAIWASQGLLSTVSNSVFSFSSYILVLR